MQLLMLFSPACELDSRIMKNSIDFLLWPKQVFWNHGNSTKRGDKFVNFWYCISNQSGTTEWRHFICIEL